MTTTLLAALEHPIIAEIGFHPESVWWLLLLGVLPLLWIVRFWSTRRRPAVRFSSIALVAPFRGGGLARFRWLPAALRDIGLVILIVCMARPIRADERTQVRVEGVAIQLVVDRSESMLAMDFELDGRRANRLEAVQQVAKEFVAGGDALTGRPNDLIGVIAFAAWADGLCPLTLDHASVLSALSSVRPASEPGEGGTSIGDAVGLALERLRGVAEGAEAAGRERIKSRVLILLTDGENNSGELDPLTAAELASSLGVRIYTIGVGRRGLAPFPVQTPFGTRYVEQEVSIDEETLQEMARLTDGRYFRATDTETLQRIYETIDALEKTETQTRRYLNYLDYAVEPLALGPVTVPPLLLTGFAFLAGALALEHSRLRPLP